MMAHPEAIIVQGLSKHFNFSVKNPDRSWLGNLVRPERREIKAVRDISFQVQPGERVAFIGPNGAGKSTTIKMLAGILFPSAGSVSILGLDPTRERKKLAYRIGTVFGQRSQLLPNLPLTDSLEFFGVMYDLPEHAIRQRMGELTELFALEAFIDQPVRKLSLGQRMRAEVAAALMHRPEIIFLDEPTIGLDVVAKKSLRDLLLRVNAEENTTIFLTSHDVGDIESLCQRTLIINHGVLIKDLPTQEVAKAFAYEKQVDVVLHERRSRFPDLPNGMRYGECQGYQFRVIVDIHQVSLQIALQKLLTLFEVEDINVYDTDLETVIRHIYAKD